MPTFEQIRDRLPSLYRPDVDDRSSLLTSFLQAVATELDLLNTEASTVLQAHWYAYADYAAYHPFLLRRRQLAGLPAVRATDVVDLGKPAPLLARLLLGADPRAQYLREQFDPETLALLDATDTSETPLPLRKALVEALDEIVRGVSIYDETRFAEVELSTGTAALAEQTLVDNDLIDLNLRLLEEAFPGELLRSQLIGLIHPQKVVTRLQAAAEPPAAYVRTQFAVTTLALLDAAEPQQPSTALQEALAEALDEIARGASIYDETRFAEVELSEETAALTDQTLKGGDLIDLNLRLLEEAFPGELLRRQPGPRILVALAHPSRFIGRLQLANGGPTQFLREQFAPETRALLEAPSALKPSVALLRSLLDALDKIARGESIYEVTRFDGVELSDETAALVDQELSGNDLIDLNLQLLEAAFPGEIVRNLLDHRYIHDLGRMASLVSLTPWQEHPRESVEEFRRRVRRIVDLYRNGLGTLGAMRRMIEAQLPIDASGPPEEQDRPFWLEEFAPLVRRTQAIATLGPPDGLLGPLMRWNLDNDGLDAVVPTIYIEAATPNDDINPAEKPVIERYSGDGLPLGLAYDRTIEPNKTLRLRPAYASWLGRDNGLTRARARPTDDAPADPTAPGPWSLVADTPTAVVRALLQAQDRTLWVAMDDAGQGRLWRYDGNTWQQVLDDIAVPHCLAEDGPDLLIGTENGALRMPLFPDDLEYVATPVPELADQAVYTIHYADDTWWFGTAHGIARQDGEAIEPFGVHLDFGTGVAVYAICQAPNGTLYFGNEKGLFLYQPMADRWYWYWGKTGADQDKDWKRFTLDNGRPDKLPDDDEVFLPPVHAVRYGPDTSLWIGTERGLARYLARSVRGLSYETVLEAFPDLTGGRIYAIEQDERGLLWFGTDRGLLRFDGRDFWEHRSNGWKQLGAASNLYDPPRPSPRGSWRFARAGDDGQWEQLLEGQGWLPRQSTTLRTTPPGSRGAVRAIAWSDSVEADLGSWDAKNETFTKEPGNPGIHLRMRYKPRADVIVEGGLPAVPRMPTGTSMWRYLALEPEDLAEPSPEDRPSWSIEGRLWLPPDLPAPWPGRYNLFDFFSLDNIEQALVDTANRVTVFAFKPAARVWASWEARRPLTVLARLKKRTPNENIDPAVIDRVWQGIQQVRPAGVRTMLAIEETIVRGKENGNT